nr:serine/threonine-protein kinase SRPK-like [Tanacetum cinerariifolium]
MKLNEEVAELNKHLEIVPDEDDDVFTEATTLARKVPVVDYSIIFLNNKPHYKIVKADGTHQLYISFLTLLKNFDRDDLESLWSIVKERFSTTKPDNFTDDFLLTTLEAIFGVDAAKELKKNTKCLILLDHLALMMELLGMMPRKIALGGRYSREFCNRHAEQDTIELADFLVLILDFVPDKRPTPTQCLNHPWLTEGPSQDLTPAANFTP